MVILDILDLSEETVCCVFATAKQGAKVCLVVKKKGV